MPPEDDLGAIGDGITDDTAAITAFWQAIQGGANVGQPNSKYRITALDSDPLTGIKPSDPW